MYFRFVDEVEFSYNGPHDCLQNEFSGPLGLKWGFWGKIGEG